MVAMDYESLADLNNVNGYRFCFLFLCEELQKYIGL